MYFSPDVFTLLSVFHVISVKCLLNFWIYVLPWLLRPWDLCWVFCFKPVYKNGLQKFLYYYTQGSILGATLFLLYINDLPDVICNTVIYADDITLYSKCDQAFDLWQQLELVSELESDLCDAVEWGRKWLVDFNAGKTQLVSINWSRNRYYWCENGWVCSWGKNYLLRCWGWLSLLNCIGALTLSISTAKTASKKIGVMIHSIKFLSPAIALHLYESTIWPCMEYCCHAWAGAPSWYFEWLDKLQKRICSTVGSSLAAFLEPLTHHWNVARLSLFYR